MKNTETIVHRIATYVRKEIMFSNLRSGQHLNESDIAKIFSVSRVPVREAFRILQCEGYLEDIPNRGNFVKPLTEEYVLEYTKVYSLLAPSLLEDAIPKYNENTYKKAEAILDKIEKCQDLNEIGYLLWDFAKTIFGPSKYKFMVSILDNVYKNNIRQLNEIFEVNHHKKYDISAHRKFIELCKHKKNRDAIRIWNKQIQKVTRLLKMNSENSHS